MPNKFSASRLNQEVMDLIETAECREAVLDDEKQQIYRLRYAAYLRDGALLAGSPEHFEDNSGPRESAKTFGVYIDGRLASSIRLHFATAATPACPALRVFSDCLRPMFETGATLVDPTRFVVNANFVRQYRALPHATIRLAWMACEQVSSAVLLTTASADRQAFYKGLFGHRVVCAPRPYPSLSTPVSLMALNFHEERERILRRHPFLNSLERERNALFGPASALGMTDPTPRDTRRSALEAESGWRAHHQFQPSQIPAVA